MPRYLPGNIGFLRVMLAADFTGCQACLRFQENPKGRNPKDGGAQWLVMFRNVICKVEGRLFLGATNRPNMIFEKVFTLV